MKAYCHFLKLLRDQWIEDWSFLICTVFVQLLLKLWIRSLTVVEVDVYRTIVRAYRVLFINFCNYFPSSFLLVHFNISFDRCSCTESLEIFYSYMSLVHCTMWQGHNNEKNIFPFPPKAKIETIQEISIMGIKTCCYSLNGKKKIVVKQNSSTELPVKCYLITKNLIHLAKNRVCFRTKRRGIKKGRITVQRTPGDFWYLIRRNGAPSRNRKSFVNHRRFITALAEEKRFISRDTSARWEIISSRPNNILAAKLAAFEFQLEHSRYAETPPWKGIVTFLFSLSSSVSLSLFLSSPPFSFLWSRHPSLRATWLPLENVLQF